MTQAPDLLTDRQTQTAAWFRTLRDSICAAFEQLEDDAPAALYGDKAGRFERTPWNRDAGGGEAGVAVGAGAAGVGLGGTVTDLAPVGGGGGAATGLGAAGRGLGGAAAGLGGVAGGCGGAAAGFDAAGGLATGGLATGGLATGGLAVGGFATGGLATEGLAAGFPGGFFLGSTGWAV